MPSLAHVGLAEGGPCWCDSSSLEGTPQHLKSQGSRSKSSHLWSQGSIGTHSALLPYPALAVCRDCTSVDCQQSSASWGQPEGHVIPLLFLMHSHRSLSHLLPCSPLLPSSLGSQTEVWLSLEAQTFARSACLAHFGPSSRSVSMMLPSRSPRNLTRLCVPRTRHSCALDTPCSQPGIKLEGEVECGSYPTSPAAPAWGQSDHPCGDVSS